MSVLAGGLRQRMIFDSLYAMIHDNLATLGWFTVGRRHAPINLVVEHQDLTTEVPINTMALTDENVTNVPWEVGSTLSEDTRYFYVDFFGENDAVAKQIIGDVRDILLGKYASIGCTAPVLLVHDYRQPTPPVAFSCDIVNVRVDRSHDYSRPWLRHWYSIQGSLLDYYTNDEDATAVQ